MTVIIIFISYVALNLNHSLQTLVAILQGFTHILIFQCLSIPNNVNGITYVLQVLHVSMIKIYTEFLAHLKHPFGFNSGSLLGLFIV